MAKQPLVGALNDSAAVDDVREDKLKTDAEEDKGSGNVELVDKMKSYPSRTVQSGVQSV